ncbi:MAG: aminopeptidase C [Bacteroidia bacterium]
MKNISLFILSCSFFLAQAQPATNKKGSEYKFTVTKSIDATAVQNQGKTGTCWSFSTLSFFESEILRAKKIKDVKLSEMFVVRKTYPLKAENYIRMHGNAQFAEGGEPSDVIACWKNYGMVPLEVYNGNLKETYNHGSMDSTLLSEMKKVVDPKNQQIDLAASKANVEATLDKFLGKAPEEFDYKGKKYTPKSYAAELGINPDDYVALSSFTHHPFYAPFILEVPDNWAWKQYNNVPLADMMKTVDNALALGYGIAWAADVTEQYFRFKDGLAVIPEGWEKMTEDEKNNCFIKPVKQQVITQERRQQEFDNWQTIDDHGMHIIGVAKDQNGGKYYLVKNSWGTKRSECDGYFYASAEYVMLKTISITVNKKTIAPELLKKIGVKP